MSSTQPPTACREVRDRLAAYLDGELVPAKTRMVSEHLGHCVDCAGERESLRLVWSQLDLTPRIGARADLWQRLDSQLAKETHAGKGIATLLATAASIGGLLLGIQLGRVTTPDPAPESQALSIQRTETSSVSPADYFSDLPVETFAANVLELAALSPGPQTGETNP